MARAFGKKEARTWRIQDMVYTILSVMKLLLIKFPQIYCVIVGVLVCNFEINPKNVWLCHPKVCNSDSQCTNQSLHRTRLHTRENNV